MDDVAPRVPRRGRRRGVFMNGSVNGAARGGLKVLKFGGTSVGAGDRLRRMAEIVAASAAEHAVVVVASAASGVTDRLVAAWEAAGTGALEPDAVIAALADRYRDLAADVLSPDARSAYDAALVPGLDTLRATLAAIADEGRKPAHRDALLAAGERLSVPLVATILCEAGLASAPHDAAPLIRTDDTHGDAVVDLKTTFRLVRQWHAALPPKTIPVVTGFIGATAAGATTTLGRGGSDYSAALLASALRAAVLERWTDVDGVYTDDPRKNKNARRLASIVLEEAWAWNQAGKLGMHRKALDPLVASGIPVHVRSTETPDQPGTLILPK